MSKVADILFFLVCILWCRFTKDMAGGYNLQWGLTYFPTAILFGFAISYIDKK